MPSSSLEAKLELPADVARNFYEGYANQTLWPLFHNFPTNVEFDPEGWEAYVEANRRFHFGMLDGPGQQHNMRLIRLLWDSTEGYRAIYYNSPEERTHTIDAHDGILDAVRRREIDEVVAGLDEHRGRALRILTKLLSRT